MFPKEAEPDRPLPSALGETEWHAIEAPKTGYLQTIEVDSLAALASKEGVILEILTPLGEFVLHNTPLLRGTWESKPDDKVIPRIQRCFNIQPFRTIEQDPAFGMRQIVDIAVKALSPGINDPTTAITCLDYLGSILNIVSELHMPSPCRSSGGKVCLVMHSPSFESLVELAFEEIRQNCQKQPVVYRSMFRAILRVVKGREITSERRLVLSRHARLILGAAQQGAILPEDLRSLEDEGGTVLALLDQKQS